MDKQFDTFQTKVRIKDIAERANVSVGTVDRVLHNRGEVAQETRDLINKIIEELEYKPNIIASVLAMKKPFLIGILMPLPVEQDSYWKLHLNGIEAAVKEISLFGVSIQKYFFEITSEESLRLQYDQLLENRPDAVLIVPVFGKAGKYVTDKLTEEKIPFSFLDTAFEGAGEHSFHGQDSYQSGYLAAKLMIYGISKETTVLMINVGCDQYSQVHQANRIKGFKAYLSENNITETNIRTIDIPSASEQDVKKALTTAFFDYSFVKGLFVTGYEIHKVAKFVDEKKLGNIRMIGYDLLESNIHYLKKGTIDFLISQNPANQGFKGVMNLFNPLVLKQPLVPTTPMPIDIVTKENVDFY
ncbi:MAG TPA: LacI family DNA-binding transcriptional regulator [Cytophagaceae bacterium]|nr:LacI family DNA-binding transcriptional regulator [Cytophagaceae bacterium]